MDDQQQAQEVLKRAQEMASGYEARISNQRNAITRLVTHHQVAHPECPWTTPAASEGTGETSGSTKEA